MSEAVRRQHLNRLAFILSTPVEQKRDCNYFALARERDRAARAALCGWRLVAWRCPVQQDCPIKSQGE